ncbi:MAG: hypothetical protein Phog2KO_29370 [Phototrophicaceae bacterium]
MFEYISSISYLDFIAMLSLSIVMFLLGWYLRTYLMSKPLEELALLKDILNKLPSHVFVKDKQLKTIFANEAFAKVVHKKPEDLYGKTDIENGWAAEFVYSNLEQGINGFEKDDLAVLKGSVINHYADSIILDNEQRYFNTIKKPLTNDDGEIIAILGFAHDVTERKNLEDTQLYNSAFQQLITTLSTEFVNWSVSEFDNGVHYMLQQIGEFIGAGRTYIYHFSEGLDFATMVHEWTADGTQPQMPNQKLISTQPFSVTFAKFREGKLDFIPNVLDMPDSRQTEKERLIARGITARITFPLIRNGQVFGSMGFHAVEGEVDWATNTVDLLKIVAELYINLLERKDTWEKVNYQASLLENVTDAIFSSDLDMTVRSWNQAAENMYGYSAKEMIGQKLTDILQSEYFGTDREDIVQSFLKNQQWKGELIRYHKDGSKINVLTSVSALRDVNGKMIGAVSVNHDISERKRLEEHQTHLTIQNERIQLLEDIIGDLSHDIKTPLSSIHVNLYLLRKQTDEAKRKEYLDRMAHSLNLLNKLVDDILTMTRLDKGAKLVLQTMDLNVLVTSVVTHYDDEIRAKMVLELAPDLKPILCSEIDLHRVFANLIDNAINYTASNEPVIIRTSAQNTMNILEIQDFGIGIDANDLPHIFDRFYRADKARDASKGGTGLGLTIVKKLVDLHNGDISVSSIPNKGTTFRIELPTTR